MSKRIKLALLARVQRFFNPEKHSCTIQGAVYNIAEDDLGLGSLVDTSEAGTCVFLSEIKHCHGNIQKVGVLGLYICEFYTPRCDMLLVCKEIAFKTNSVYLIYSSQPLEILVLTKLNPLPI